MQRRQSSTVRVYYPRLSRERAISLLRKGAIKIAERLPLRALLLFGSYAKDRYTASSDIDVVVVYDGSKKEDAYDICWELLGGGQLELHVFTASEYERMKEEGNRFFRELQRSGVTIWEGGRFEGARVSGKAPS